MYWLILFSYYLKSQKPKSSSTLGSTDHNLLQFYLLNIFQMGSFLYLHHYRPTAHHHQLLPGLFHQPPLSPFLPALSNCPPTASRREVNTHPHTYKSNHINPFTKISFKLPTVLQIKVAYKALQVVTP